MIYNLVQICQNSAKEFGHNDAFRYLNEVISFNDLDVKSSQLAKHLYNLGIKKGDRVGILMPRCLETAIAVYGILKSGAAYVPIDPFSPLERAKFLIEDCGIKHVITIPQQIKKIKKLTLKNKNLTSIVGISNEEGFKSITWEDVFKISLKNYVPANILGEDLSYILYTSGSTGTPKGIMHTHNSALAFAELVVDLYDFKPTDKVANVAPLHFDPSILGYFSAPLAGATTVIVSDGHLKFPVSLAELMEKEQLTIWFSVPLVLVQLMLNGGIKNRDFSSLRWVLFSGEVFPTKQLRALMKIWPHAIYSNIYGPTELNQCTNYNLYEPPIGDDTIPIGTTWGNTEFKILDENDNEVKEGEVGLLVIRSATMMQGYWNNIALTEKSMYNLEVAPGFMHVYYRTGDLVKLNNKGELLFLGRKDRQIKLRGFRIEIDEIENILLKFKGVVEAAVVLADLKEEKELIATVLTDKNSKISTKDLEKHCNNELPVYALPSKILILDAFPRTSTGKINRKEMEKIIKP
ncbi:amino acid adenylation domain-containing protein [Algibacter luteus]|uniref:Amino acid adenylation domain-containing protein n=1 Tax=Algibacter luteus TaxID=1178825 RepID=A0A1M6BSZ4_9FLAO|nr:amino acid adenylation domain-containing protein [Algibacter luteus]SHI51856.1 amino acid adenylation domain-containing protein [Algibacter luteus]